MTTTPCPPLPERYEPWPDAEQATIGCGGMADVYRARDRLLGDKVAVKVIRREVMTSPEFRDRFEREVRFSAAVVHPHLVPLHDLGELPDGRPYLALALADAGSLLELRRQNPPWRILRRVVNQALSALACLHSHGVLHLDVKLSNVLLTRLEGGQYRAWLSDMGLARALTDKEMFLRSLAGTLSYMPAEILQKRYAEIGPPADLFAVGVMLYRLVAGTNPFKEGTLPEHMNKRYRPPRIVPVRRGLVIPEGLTDIIVRLLQPDPRARYDLAADIRAALDALPRLPDDVDEDSLTDPGIPLVPPRRAFLDVSPEVDDEVPEVDDYTFSALPGVPEWNRPSIPGIPAHPPREPGLGSRARASLALYALREVPLVGRDDARQTLWDMARNVAETGQPAAIVLRGELGVGKTRLVQSVTRPLEEGGHATILEVNFTKGGSPGNGYTGAVRRLLRLEGQDPASTRRRLERWIARESQTRDPEVMLEAMLLQRWAVPEAGIEPVTPLVAREYLFKHLHRNAWRGLSVLVVEDAQWCTAEDDGASLVCSLLQLGLPVLAIVTVRSDPLELEPSAAAALRSLVALGAEEMDLERIGPDDMAGLVQECLPLEDVLATEIVQRSAGIPYFAKDLIGQWCQQGALKAVEVRSADGRPASDIRFRLAAPAENGIPKDIRALLAGRLSNLIQQTRSAAQVGRALDVVGVAGSGVPWLVLEEAAGPGVAELLGAGLVHDRQGVAAVDHPLMAQLLRERVGGRGAHDAHARLALAWARVAQDPRALLETGRHALAAGQLDEAAGYLARAVEGFSVAGSVPEMRMAAQDLNLAKGGVAHGGDAWTLAQLALARADLAEGKRLHAVSRIEFLLSAEPVGDLAIEVVALYIEALEYSDRERLGLPALETVEPFLASASPRVRARFHQARGICLLHLTRDEAAELEIRRGLEVVDHEPLRAELHFHLGRSVASRDPEQALVHLGDAANRASRNGYRSLQAQAMATMARLHGVQGRWEEGQAMAEEAERLAVAIGFRTYVPLCRNARAECLRFQGRIREAEALYREGRGRAYATDQRAWCHVFDLNLALCALLVGSFSVFRLRLDTIAREEDPNWEPFAQIFAAMEAIHHLQDGGGREALDRVNVDRVLQEGLDGALVSTILARTLQERGFHEDAMQIQDTVRAGMTTRGLRPSDLEPMLQVYEDAVGC